MPLGVCKDTAQAKRLAQANICSIHSPMVLEQDTELLSVSEIESGWKDGIW